MTIEIVSFPTKNGGSFQFVMWTFTRGLRQSQVMPLLCWSMTVDWAILIPWFCDGWNQQQNYTVWHTLQHTNSTRRPHEPSADIYCYLWISLDIYWYLLISNRHLIQYPLISIIYIHPSPDICWIVLISINNIQYLLTSFLYIHESVKYW